MKIRKTETNRAQLVRLTGAHMETEDNGRVTYSPWDDIVVNVEQIGAVYDHTIVIMGHKIRVMESLEEIMKRIGAAHQ